MPPTILIVDDHEFMRTGIRAMIAKWRPEWKVCGEAADGEEAVRAVVALRPDIVILDVSMPIMSGLEAAARIAMLPLLTRVLLLTGHESGSVTLATGLHGSRAYVDKSQVIRELIPTIDTLLAGAVQPA